MLNLEEKCVTCSEEKASKSEGFFALIKLPNSSLNPNCFRIVSELFVTSGGHEKVTGKLPIYFRFELKFTSAKMNTFSSTLQGGLGRFGHEIAEMS